MFYKTVAGEQTVAGYIRGKKFLQWPPIFYTFAAKFVLFGSATKNKKICLDRTPTIVFWLFNWPSIFIIKLFLNHILLQ